MRHKRLWLVIGLVALMVAGTTAVASAHETDGEVDLAGRGWLAAKGSGQATLDMGGWIKVRINGDVAITNLGDNFEVRLRAAGSREGVTESVGPDVVLDDYRGWLAVRGNHFLIEMEGDMRFLAHGRGVAHLEGRGIYKTRRGPIRPWSPTGADVAIEPSTTG